MIKIYCNDIENAFTNCEQLAAIYTHGELVWPTGPTPPGEWYVKWTPDDLSGTFSMFGQTYNLEDYSGYYSWIGSGMITSGAFKKCSLGTMETNVISIQNGADSSMIVFNGAFQSNKSLTDATLVKCRYIGSNTFLDCILLSHISMSKVYEIDNRAFYSCYSLESINIPNCYHIDSEAFAYCSSLSQVYAPKLESVRFMTFIGCHSLESINLPLCSNVGAAAFAGCHSLSKINLPVCKNIEAGGFGGCYSLTDISLPECVSIQADGFENCSSLESVYLPACIQLAGFANCTSLKTISAPVAETVANLEGCTALQSIYFPAAKQIATCSGCTSLQSVDLPVCSKILSGTFNNCTSLDLLILSSKNVVNIVSNGHTFQNTPLANCSGSILVPPQILGNYRRASVWSSLSCVLDSIPDYPSASYYINWTPINLTTKFHIDGVTYITSDFNGSFPWLYDGVITKNAFAANYSGQTNTSKITYIETNAYSIGESAFYGCSSLSQISFSNCKHIGENAFAGCRSLESIDIPVCEYIGSSAFQYCSSLSTIDINNVKYIGSRAFYNCSSLLLSQINLPYCEYIGDRAFNMDIVYFPLIMSSTLTVLDLPVCSYIGGSATFRSCSQLSYVNIPSCLRIYSWTFAYCYSLTNVIMSSVKRIEEDAFLNCSMINEVNLPECSYIGRFAFNGCKKLSVLTLGSTSVCEIYDSYVFGGTLLNTSTGSILVPTSLVSEYKSSYYWSYFANRIFPIPT